MKKIGFLFVLFSSIVFSHAADTYSKPNIVILLADDFGWGSLGCYGAVDVKTPNIDKLAKEGRKFTQAYAPGSVCSPSRYGLMTGRYYWRTSIKDGEVLAPNSPLHIERNRLTLASLAKSQGYATAIIGKWHLGMTKGGVTDWKKPLSPGPLQVGFDHYFGMAANVSNPPRSFIDDEEISDYTPWKPDHIMETLVKKTTQWIEANKDHPFFLYYAPNAVHEPVVPNPKFRGSSYGSYGDFIDELDSSVGQILATLDKLNLSNDTIVIFTSDNGGVIDETNKNSQTAIKAGLAINGPLKGGKHTEWEGGFREPFIIRWPGKVPAGTLSNQVICLTDMAASIAHIIHATLPKNNAEDSFDVTRAFFETTQGVAVHNPLILQAADATYCIRVGNWKFIERANVPAYDSSRTKLTIAAAKLKQQIGPQNDELYNLKDDPYETNNVIAQNQSVARDLKLMLINSRDSGYTRLGSK
jgi:arylsulfatase A-like enzyme